MEALLRRDACLAQMLWDSQRRPSKLTSLPSSGVSHTEAGVHARASSSKMCHVSRSSRVPRPVVAGGAAGQLLGQLLQQYTGCLSRHQQPDGKALQVNKGLSTNAITQRIVGHLQRLHMHVGETVYSIKRGSMQHAFHVQGRSLHAIGEGAQAWHKVFLRRQRAWASEKAWEAPMVGG